ALPIFARGSRPGHGHAAPSRSRCTTSSRCTDAHPHPCDLQRRTDARPQSAVLLSSRSASQLRALTTLVVLLAGRLGHRSHTLTTRGLHRQTFNPRVFSIELIELGHCGGLTGLSLLLQLLGLGVQLLLGAVLAQGVLCAGRPIWLTIS